MKKKLFIIFIVLGVMLFCILILGYIPTIVKIADGIYVCNREDFYGELEIKQITEDDFNNANGLNVFKMSGRMGCKYYSIVLSVVFSNTEEKMFLDFLDLETYEESRYSVIPFNSSIFCYFYDKNALVKPCGNHFYVDYMINDYRFYDDFYKQTT